MNTSPNKRQKAYIESFCRTWNNISINPQGQLIEQVKSGYTLIEGLDMYSTGVEFEGIIIKTQL